MFHENEVERFTSCVSLCLFSDETQKLLKELANRKPLQVPNIYHHLPHLLNNEGSLHPAVQVGLGRTGGEKCIPTLQIQFNVPNLQGFLFVLFCFFFVMCIACSSCISTANPLEILITPERKSSLNKFSLFD